MEVMTLYMQKVKDKFHYNILTFCKTLTKPLFSSISQKQNLTFDLILNSYTNFRYPRLNRAAMLKILCEASTFYSF